MADYLTASQKAGAMEVARNLCLHSREEGTDAGVCMATAKLVGAVTFLESTIGPRQTRKTIIALLDAIGTSGSVEN